MDQHYQFQHNAMHTHTMLVPTGFQHTCKNHHLDLWCSRYHNMNSHDIILGLDSARRCDLWKTRGFHALIAGRMTIPRVESEPSEDSLDSDFFAKYIYFEYLRIYKSFFGLTCCFLFLLLPAHCCFCLFFLGQGIDFAAKPVPILAKSIWIGEIPLLLANSPWLFLLNSHGFLTFFDHISIVVGQLPSGALALYTLRSAEQGELRMICFNMFQRKASTRNLEFIRLGILAVYFLLFWYRYLLPGI